MPTKDKQTFADAVQQLIHKYTSDRYAISCGDMTQVLEGAVVRLQKSQASRTTQDTSIDASDTASLVYHMQVHKRWPRHKKPVVGPVARQKDIEYAEASAARYDAEVMARQEKEKKKCDP